MVDRRIENLNAACFSPEDMFEMSFAIPGAAAKEMRR
jgi:hypothetical protein